MPNSSSSRKVLVTGANGFIARWVVRTLLDEGYTVRGTVRSEEKGKALRKSYGAYGSKFETAVVQDIAEDGAFDEAVKDVDFVEHLASPCHTNADDPDELIRPAVNGTVGLLQSILKHNAVIYSSPKVQRVVITSSCATVVEDLPHPKVFSELDWNGQCLQIVQELGKDAPGLMKYRASKTLAEKAAWNFVQEHGHEIAWDIVTMNPPYVLGPMEAGTPLNEPLNTSLSHLLKMLFASTSPSPMPYSAGLSWVDVRDVAMAHVRSLEAEKAGGERIILSASPCTWQSWVDRARALNPPVQLPPGKSLATGDPSASNTPPKVTFNNVKSEILLGIKYRTMEATTRDILEDIARRQVTL
ncbi:hypothetical protein ONZ45_g9655 [Pleurotus djamor]|nr:hypothetical protein ONZ45_g9655 [Pleurotus djamor]